MYEDNPDVLAYVREARNGYEVCARWNAKGKFRVVEKLPTWEQADLFAKQLNGDDRARHQAWNETRDWDFVTDALKKPRAKREPRPPRVKEEPIRFSFTD